MHRPLLLTGLMCLTVSVWSQMTTVAGTSMIVDAGTNLRIHGPWTWSVEGGASLVNNGTIELDPNAAFTEVLGSPVSGSGTELIDLTYSTALVNEEPGGLGLRITTSTTLGNTVVERGHAPFTDYSGHTSIARWYRVEPTTNGGLNASIELGYDPLELNGLAEPSLVPHIRYAVDIWYPLTGLVNTGSHFIASSGLDSLGTFTAFDEDLPNGVVRAESTSNAWLRPNAGPHVELVFADGGYSGSVRVIDARGALVRSIDPVQASAPIDLQAENLSPGLYLVHLANGHTLRFMR